MLFMERCLLWELRETYKFTVWGNANFLNAGDACSNPCVVIPR
jgi:hypothetical protein